jgi:hypothetical protein
VVVRERAREGRVLISGERAWRNDQREGRAAFLT